MTKPRRDLTDEELRAVARWVARTQLEVERGHRPAKALRGVLAPHLYHGLEHAERPAGAPPVAARDIGSASFTRLAATTGYAVVVVREADGRWEALTMVLRRNDRGVWAVHRHRPAIPVHLATVQGLQRSQGAAMMVAVRRRCRLRCR